MTTAKGVNRKSVDPLETTSPNQQSTLYTKHCYHTLLKSGNHL